MLCGVDSANDVGAGTLPLLAEGGVARGQGHDDAGKGAVGEGEWGAAMGAVLDKGDEGLVRVKAGIAIPYFR